MSKKQYAKGSVTGKGGAIFTVSGLAILATNALEHLFGLKFDPAVHTEIVLGMIAVIGLVIGAVPDLFRAVGLPTLAMRFEKATDDDEITKGEAIGLAGAAIQDFSGAFEDHGDNNFESKGCLNVYLT